MPDPAALSDADWQAWATREMAMAVGQVFIADSLLDYKVINLRIEHLEKLALEALAAFNRLCSERRKAERELGDRFEKMGSYFA